MLLCVLQAPAGHISTNIRKHRYVWTINMKELESGSVAVVGPGVKSRFAGTQRH